MPRTKDLTGMRFGRLTVIKESENSIRKKNVHRTWLCLCDCGKEKTIRSSALTGGKTVSCGCYGVEQRAKGCTKHNHSNDRLYKLRRGMMQRCNNPKAPGYESYGGRGITICDEWLGENGFINFYNWAISNGYSDELTIDRIDVNGNYEPSNCRWVTIREQNYNKRSTHYITAFGKTQSMAEWVKEYRLNKSTFYARIKAGWNPEDAILLKPHQTGSYAKYKGYA